VLSLFAVYFRRRGVLALPAVNTQKPLPTLRTLAVLPAFRMDFAFAFAAVLLVWQLSFLYLRVFVAIFEKV